YQFAGLATSSVNGALTPVAGDLNGDGRDDLLWYSPGNTSKWTALGGMQFKAEPVATDGTRLVPVAGDFDGDHRSDVFWYSGGGTDPLWLSQEPHHPAPARLNGQDGRGERRPRRATACPVPGPARGHRAAQ